MFNSMLDELKGVKYFKEKTDFKNLIYKILWRSKRWKSLQKVEPYLEPKHASRTELFCEYTKRLPIFAIKVSSQMFDWVIYEPPKILKFSKWS